MGGAPRLAGEAALRVGSGLVSVATRNEHAFAMLAGCPELMAKGVEGAQDLKPLLSRATVVVLGPGLGRSDWSKNLFKAVLDTSLPLIVDADGLNLLAEIKHPITRNNWILTPHPGEASRLLEQTIDFIQGDRPKALNQLQQLFGGVVVLKGKGSLVFDGGNNNAPAYLCKSGNPGLSTAGTGDILSGIIAGLVAQNLPLKEAACLGVMLHATAGDKAVEEKGERGLLARDLLAYVRQYLNGLAPLKPLKKRENNNL